MVWDMRYASPGPINFNTPDPTNPYELPETGHLAMAGTYKVSLSKFENGEITELVPAQNFVIKSLSASSLPAPDSKALDTFSKKVSELRRATGAADSYRGELTNKIKFIKSAIISAQLPQGAITKQVHEVEKRLHAADIKMNGDASIAKREFETPPSINGRIGTIEGTLWTATSAPTQTAINSFDVASKQFAALLPELKSIDEEIKKVEAEKIKVEPVAKPSNINLSTDLKTGVFKSSFLDSGNEEKGTAGVFKSTSGWEDGKYYCLQNNAAQGAIVKITNPATGKSIYAKVLDVMPDLKQNNNLAIRISNAAADALGAGAANFECEINY